MNQNFTRYGDIFKASVSGNNAYVVSDPEYCEQILRTNWLNYPRKGLVVQRIALALGHNLITNNGVQLEGLSFRGQAEGIWLRLLPTKPKFTFTT